MSTKDDGLSDSADDWRAAGWGTAELVITVGEIMDAKDSYGDMIVQGKVVVEGERDQVCRSRRVSASNNATFDAKLDGLKIPPPPTGKEGGICNWYKRDGEFFIELISLEDDGMTGKEKQTVLGKASLRIRDLVDKDKSGGLQKKSLKNETLSLGLKAGFVMASVALILPKAGLGASNIHRPKGTSRAEMRAKQAERDKGSSFAAAAAASCDTLC